MSKNNQKYSKELLQDIASKCYSLQQVMRELGLKISGGSSSHLKSRFMFYNIDISHFTGCSSNKGKICSEKLKPEQILVNNRFDGRRDRTNKIKRAMLESNIEEKCKLCGLEKYWNNNPIILQIDHINGDGTDNRIENLRFLCPNCHSQTETFCSKNIKRD